MKVTFISRKGGVGKTTSAVNLAAELAALGHRVLLIDLDAQCSASLSLGVERRFLAPSISDVLTSERTLVEVIRPSSVPGLDLVTGSVDLADLELRMLQVPKREQLLRRIFDAEELEYDFVLFDCPAGLGLLPRASLLAAEVFLIPIAPQFLILDGLNNFLAAIGRHCQRLQVRPRLLGVLLTQVDYRVNVTRQYVNELRSDYGSWIFGVEVRTNVRVAEAPSYGVPVREYAPKSTGAAAYRLLAEEFLMRCEGREDVAVETAQPVAGHRVTVTPAGKGGETERGQKYARHPLGAAAGKAVVPLT